MRSPALGGGRADAELSLFTSDKGAKTMGRSSRAGARRLEFSAGGLRKF
jgi:hypothetical protein